MSAFFELLHDALCAQGAFAYATAAIWGAVSMLLSPCSFVLIPMVIGYIRHNSSGGTKNALTLSLVFTAGVFLNIAAIGAAVCYAGTLLSHLSFFAPAVNYAAAGLLFLFGLHLLDVIELPGHGHHHMQAKGAGLWGALTLGVISGLAAGPCAITHFAPVLIVAFKAAGSTPLFSACVVLAYALGYCSVIIAAGLSSEKISQHMRLAEGSRSNFILTQICGWLVILAGAHFLYEA